MNNHALLTDLYEFSMANGYLATLPDDRWAVFDVFFRTVPDDGSFVIAAGLAQVVDQLKDCTLPPLTWPTSSHWASTNQTFLTTWPTSTLPGPSAPCRRGPRSLPANRC